LTRLWNVRVEPGGVELAVREGETLMEAAARAQVTWPTTCGMQGICTVCYLRVESGVEALSPIGPNEERTLNMISHRHPNAKPGELRIACLAYKSMGDLVVYKRGVRHLSPVGDESRMRTEPQETERT
jgi:2Fe-2S ferredoxin